MLTTASPFPLPDRLPPRARRPRLPNRRRRRQRPALRALRPQAPDFRAQARRRGSRRRQQRRRRRVALQPSGIAGSSGGGERDARRTTAAPVTQERALQHADRVRAPAARRGRDGDRQPGGRTPEHGRQVPQPERKRHPAPGAFLCKTDDDGASVTLSPRFPFSVTRDP